MFPFLKEFKASVTTDKDKVGRVFPDTGLPFPLRPGFTPGSFVGVALRSLLLWCLAPVKKQKM